MGSIQDSYLSDLYRGIDQIQSLDTKQLATIIANLQGKSKVRLDLGGETFVTIRFYDEGFKKSCEILTKKYNQQPNLPKDEKQALELQICSKIMETVAQNKAVYTLAKAAQKKVYLCGNEETTKLYEQKALEKNKEKEAQGLTATPRVIQTLSKEALAKIQEKAKQAIDIINQKIQELTGAKKEEKKVGVASKTEDKTKEEIAESTPSMKHEVLKEAKQTDQLPKEKASIAEEDMQEEEAHLEKDRQAKKEAEAIAKSDALKHTEETKQDLREEETKG